MRSSITLSIVLAVLPVSAQETPQRLVELSVIATTNKDEPVTDLEASEVHLKEDGKARPLAFFRFAGSRRQIAAPAAGEFINRPAPPPTVILFDRWNETIMLAAEAWSDIGNAIQRLESVDRVYIYFLTPKGELYPVRPLPPADADLRGAAPVQAAQLRAALDETVKKLNGFRDMDVLDPGIRANTTLKALANLGTQMSAIAGEKTLLWVTRGFPLQLFIQGQSIDFTAQVRGIATAMVQSKVALSAVDQSARGAGADPVGESRQTLQTFSELTGGRWYESGDTVHALNQSISDTRGEYRVAYYSDFRQNDKKEHKIRIESSRKNVRFVTREGYFGNTPEPDPNIMEKASFNAESRSPFDASEIAVRVEFKEEQGGEHLTIHVNPSDILLAENGGEYQGHLSVAFAVYSSGTFKGATKPVDTAVNLSKDQLAQAQKDGIVLNQDVPHAEGADRLRVMVYDAGLHALGTVTIPLK
jgi:VWFA-related protein